VQTHPVARRRSDSRAPASDDYALGDCAALDGKLQPYVLPIMHAARALARTLNGDATRRASRSR
jgi:rubredoxin-NAD+ reductase